MVDVPWGLLGPGTIFSERRTRALGVSRAVRRFNDLAVPGLGSVWFGKQLLLSSLGLLVAEGARRVNCRVRNIETANAIEAVACWTALEATNWQSEPRLRGANTMRHAKDLSFRTVRKPGFYVTQPMRMSTVQPVRELGLSEAISQRYNTYQSTEHCENLVNAAHETTSSRGRNSLLGSLVDWVKGTRANVHTSSWLAEILNPLTVMTPACREILRELLIRGGDENTERRRAVLTWVRAFRNSPLKHDDWTDRPACITQTHWMDMQAGAQFLEARSAAVVVLNQLEVDLANQHANSISLDTSVTARVAELLENLRLSAKRFLDLEADRSLDGMASTFCRECSAANPVQVLESLIMRDGRGLMLNGREVTKGVAFRGVHSGDLAPDTDSDEEGAEMVVDRGIDLPPGISYRVNNLFLLNLDLDGELDNWLHTDREAASG